VNFYNGAASAVDELNASVGHRWNDTHRDIQSTRSIEKPIVPQPGIKFLTNYGAK
jgi:hypothetical protein